MFYPAALENSKSTVFAIKFMGKRTLFPLVKVSVCTLYTSDGHTRTYFSAVVTVPLYHTLITGKKHATLH